MRITKALKAEFEAKVAEIVKNYNPYIKEAIKYSVGNTPMFIYANTCMTKEEIDKAYMETALKDIQRGYEERMVGYYDKWYRYNHADEGTAYDAGQRIAIKNPKCSGEFQIIECTC